MNERITVIGAAVVDVLAVPVGPEVFVTGSEPMEDVRISFGGDALNEAVGLARLGKPPFLITKLGKDEAGGMVQSYLERERVPREGVILDPDSVTGVNLVLVDRAGERNFCTNPKSTLRTLSKGDILRGLSALPKGDSPSAESPSSEPHSSFSREIFSFASVFVSSALSLRDMEEVFETIKNRDALLTADFTRAKRGEKLGDLAGILPCLDAAFINAREAEALTGVSDPLENVRLLRRAGVSTVAVKTGAKGCLLCPEGENTVWEVPSVSGVRCLDTTGAGDSFAAGFLWALSEGKSLICCARMGAAVASLSIERLGAVEGITSLSEALAREKTIGAEKAVGSAD